MSDRERWIIYPLLFMALGVALRDKIIKTTASQRIQTESLLVTGSDGNVIAVLGHERFGELINHRHDTLVVDSIRTRELVAERVRVTDALSADTLAATKSLKSPVAIITGLVEAGRVKARSISAPQAWFQLVFSNEYYQVVGNRAFRLMYFLSKALDLPTQPDDEEPAAVDEPESADESEPEQDGGDSTEDSGQSAGAEDANSVSGVAPER